MYRSSDIRSDTDNFDKGDLKDELKSAGFEDCVVDNIADRVNDRKADGWSMRHGREEANREIQVFLDSTRRAYDRYREITGFSRETTVQSDLL